MLRYAKDCWVGHALFSCCLADFERGLTNRHQAIQVHGHPFALVLTQLRRQVLAYRRGPYRFLQDVPYPSLR